MRIRSNLEFPKTIIVHIGGRVHSIDPLTGVSIWKTKLTSSLNSYYATLVLECDTVFVQVGRYLASLDKQDGRVIWSNKFKGVGLPETVVPRTGTIGTAQAAHMALNPQCLQQDQLDGPGKNMQSRTNLDLSESTFIQIGRNLHAINPVTGEVIWKLRLAKISITESVRMSSDKETVYVFSIARIYAVNKTDGKLCWQVRLPKKLLEGGGAEITVLSDIMLIGANGSLFALDKQDGRLLWENGFKGCGYGVVNIRTEAPDGTTT